MSINGPNNIQIKYKKSKKHKIKIGVMCFSCKFWGEHSRRQGTERDVETVASTVVEAAELLKELEYFRDIEAEGSNGNRAIILSFPTYAKQDS